jgi:DNA-binding MarR family transcriptional regulator
MSKEVDLAINDINNIIVDLFNNILKLEQKSLESHKYNLTIKEIHILEAINKTSIPTMSNIADSVEITVGTLTSSVNRLVKKGFVERYNDEFDRRKVMLKLTPEAKKVIILHTKFHKEMVRRILDGYSEEEIELLSGMLGNLQKYFKEI